MFSSYYMTPSGQVYPNQVNQDDVRVAVIAYEDREQVERLAAGYERDSDPGEAAVDQMQAALREFASPKPPKPDEPMGLGAVVEDADGDPWVRFSLRGDVDWVCDRPGKRENRQYVGINAVRIANEGVPS